MAILFLFIGSIIFLIGSIGLLIDAFREHILWGLFCLFTQIGSIIFAIVHFDKCKRSLAYMLTGLLLVILSAIFSFSGERHLEPYQQDYIEYTE